MAELVGILNLTPDSFSDGGTNFAPDMALRTARSMLKGGAAVLDVGAESTRPGATLLSSQEEWARLTDVLPSLVAMAHQARAQVSLDTRHAATAQKALALGIDWINDVSGGQDPALFTLVAASRCQYVLMHALSVPPDGRHIDAGLDVVQEVKRWWETKLAECEAAGLSRSRIVLDPGLGFGKTPEQNLALVRRADELKSMGCRVLMGHSRKSFLAPYASPPDNRDPATISASLWMAEQGVDYLRVHVVPEHAQALAIWKVLKADA